MISASSTLADICPAIYLATTTAKQIRRSFTSQAHIFYSTETQCHSLTCTFAHSLNHVFHSSSLAHTLIPQPLTQVPIIKLGRTQGRRFISLPKGGKVKEENRFVLRKIVSWEEEKKTLTKGQGQPGRSQTKTELVDNKKSIFP